MDIYYTVIYLLLLVKNRYSYISNHYSQVNIMLRRKIKLKYQRHNPF